MCAQRLRAAEAERDRFKNQYEKSLSELQQRTERISLVESQRTKIQERLNHMDAQVRILLQLLAVNPEDRMRCIVLLI